MWFVYHVMPALLAAASGICLYVSLRHMPCDAAAGRKVKLAATLLAVAGMLDFCSVWTLFMMHLCVFLLLWLLLRKLAHRRMIWGFPLSCLLALALIIGGMGNARVIHRTYYELVNDKLNDDLRIVWLSDLHYPTALDSDALRELCARISAEHADLIILGGDIVDEQTNAAQMQEAFSALGQMRSTLGTYFIYGNHDRARYADQPAFSDDQLAAAISSAGIRILQDTQAMPRDDIVLIGREDPAYARHQDVPSIDNSDVCHIVLDHRPLQLQENAAAGHDLQLSGHTHDGQIFPLGTLCAMMGLNEWEYGMWTQADLTAIVSSGAGTWGYPVRTQGISEYVCIDIKKAADACASAAFTMRPDR